ncbi:MAG: leucine-rich repeat domain-containing protein, partial [Treponema sp.]|nr:leucine-rich repeat domain-containing protein [Treponema sp.]
MARRSVNMNEKAAELKAVLEKYNGIPSQTQDRKAYANIKYYAKNYANHPKIKELLEEFNVKIGCKGTVKFESTLDEIKQNLDELGLIPSIKDNQSLYCSIRYFFKKYENTPEVEELKHIYAHSSCYPLPESKAIRPEYEPNTIYIGCVPDYVKWKQNSAFEYILFVYRKYGKLPARNTKPMEELRYSIGKWYRYQDQNNSNKNLKFLLENLINLGCQEEFVEEAFNSFSFGGEGVQTRINELLISHGACTIAYLSKVAMPGFRLADKFVFYYFYNLMNDSPKLRKICGLGELFSGSNYTVPIYVHYRLLDKCDVNAIRRRVIAQNRDWEKNPPETVKELEDYGEYCFFIPNKSSDWNREEYRTTDKPFPLNCIENGHPYFRYYKSGDRYLDYKLFLSENGLSLQQLKDSYDLNRLSTLSLAEKSSFDNSEDAKAAFILANKDSECWKDEEGGIYINTEDGLQLVYAPQNAIAYEINSETVKISRNAFLPCKETLHTLKVGSKIGCTHTTKYPNLEKLIIPREKLTEYCLLFPKYLTNHFCDYNDCKLNVLPIVKDNTLIWVPYVTRFEVPYSIKEISSNAFSDSPIEEVIISGSVKKIGSLLYGCNSLKKITLQEGVDSIWGSAFAHCTNLIEVELPESLASLYNSFEGCTSIERIHLKKNLNYIGYNTFKGCENLSEITIDGHLRTLNFSAFDGCNKIKILTFNYGIDNLEHNISNCRNLEQIVFKGNYKSLGYNPLTFYNCPNLKGIYVPEEFYDLFLSHTQERFK